MSELKPKIHGLDNKNCKGVVIGQCVFSGETVEMSGNKQIRENGFSPSGVCLCIAGKQKSHKGYTFAREDRYK